MRRAEIGPAILTFAFSIVVMPLSGAAKDTPQRPLVPTKEPSASSGSPGSPAEIETAIRTLSDPLDADHLNKIFSGLDHLEDPNEQQRLQQLLDEHIRKLSQAPEHPAAQPPAVEKHDETQPAPKREWSDEEFQRRIEAMNLGSEATADDLRGRDEVVAAIAAVRDPGRREKFLKLLEERERDTETAVYRPREADKRVPSRR